MMKMAVQNISKKDILIAQNLNKVETWGLCEDVWLGYPYSNHMATFSSMYCIHFDIIFFMGQIIKYIRQNEFDQNVTQCDYPPCKYVYCAE